MIGAEGEPEIRPLPSSQVVSRPVAQKQSARLISGRPRSVTAPDDQPLDGVVSLHACLKPRRCRCDSDSSGQYKVGAMEDWSAGVLKPITPLLPYSAVPFRASVNAKQLAQPVFQAGPSRCKSGHGRQVVQCKLLSRCNQFCTPLCEGGGSWCNST